MVNIMRSHYLTQIDLGETWDDHCLTYVVSMYPYGMLYSVQLGNTVIIYNELYTMFSCD